MVIMMIMISTTRMIGIIARSHLIIVGDTTFTLDDSALSAALFKSFCAGDDHHCITAHHSLAYFYHIPIVVHQPKSLAHS